MFEEIIAENFPNLRKQLFMFKNHRESPEKRSTPRNIIIKIKKKIKIKSLIINKRKTITSILGVSKRL